MNEPSRQLVGLMDEKRDDGRTLLTLHYELSAEVKSIREKIIEAKNDLRNLEIEVRRPKPIQWGAIATGMGAVFTVVTSIGALIAADINTRITENKQALESIDARHVKREDAMTPHAEFQAWVTGFMERQKRIEQFVDKFNELMAPKKLDLNKNNPTRLLEL